MSGGTQHLAQHMYFESAITMDASRDGYIAECRPVGGNKTEALNLENYGLKTVSFFTLIFGSQKLGFTEHMKCLLGTVCWPGQH